MMHKSFLSTVIILTVLVFAVQVQAQDKELPPGVTAVPSDPAVVKPAPSGPVAKVESGKFMFKAVRAYPSGGGGGVAMAARASTVKMDGDHATGNLAFFGTNTSAPFNNNGGGIEFDGEISNKRIKKKEKKQQMTMSFSISGIRDSYKCIFTISGTGLSTLNVSSNKKSPISYQGYIYPLPEK